MGEAGSGRRLATAALVSRAARAQASQAAPLPVATFCEWPATVQFGGARSRRHDCSIKVESDIDGSIRVHLVAEVRGARTAVLDILTWDPVAENLAWRNRAELAGIAERLDTGVALSNLGNRAIRILCDEVGRMLEGLASANIIIIGGAVPTLIAFFLLKALLWIALKVAFVYVFLPGFLAGCLLSAFSGLRVRKLEAAAVSAAWGALNEYRAARALPGSTGA